MSTTRYLVVLAAVHVHLDDQIILIIRSIHYYYACSWEKKSTHSSVSSDEGTPTFGQEESRILHLSHMLVCSLNLCITFGVSAEPSSRPNCHLDHHLILIDSPRLKHVGRFCLHSLTLFSSVLKSPKWQDNHALFLVPSSHQFLLCLFTMLVVVCLKSKPNADLWSTSSSPLPLHCIALHVDAIPSIIKNLKTLVVVIPPPPPQFSCPGPPSDSTLTLTTNL
ncbi:unnamed protein product, partial [Choristocarpus tenellus]